MRGLGADDEYWKGLAQGKVRVQRCTGCGHWHIPAVWRCGECGSWELQWNEVKPQGRIFTWTRTWHEFGSPVELGRPLALVVVELDDAGGRRLLGTMVDPLAELKIGQRVVGEVIQTTSQEETIPALRWKFLDDANAAPVATGGQTS